MVAFEKGRFGIALVYDYGADFGGVVAGFQLGG